MKWRRFVSVPSESVAIVTKLTIVTNVTNVAIVVNVTVKYLCSDNEGLVYRNAFVLPLINDLLHIF